MGCSLISRKCCCKDKSTYQNDLKIIKQNDNNDNNNNESSLENENIHLKLQLNSSTKEKKISERQTKEELHNIPIKNNNELEQTNQKPIDIYINDNKYKKDNKEIIKYPKLVLIISDSINNSEISQVQLTPNSINGKTIEKSNNKYIKYTFGNNDSYSYIIPCDQSTEQKFTIYLDNHKNKYYVQDDKSGTGLFVKLKDKIQVFNGMLISFYIDFMYITIIPDQTDNNNKELRIKFIKGQFKQRLVFNSKDKKIIKIGRDKLCDFVYDNDSISKVQCTFVYDSDNWFLYDGCYNNYQLKNSTNGLWFLANHKYELKKGTIFKTGMLKILVKDFVSVNIR